MTERGAVQERLNQLLSMEEECILVGFHQQVHKARDKALARSTHQEENVQGRRSSISLQQQIVSALGEA
jgi:hypothetical protein